MGEQLLVSIIIPCYNQGRFLAEAINSVLTQTYRPIEVLVMDDGSTDETSSVARSYGEKIQYRRLPHLGLPQTRNTALKIMKGEFWANLDSDNIFEPSFIKEMLEFLLSSSETPLDFAYCQRSIFRTSPYDSHVSRFPEFNLEKLKERNYLDANCALIRTASTEGIYYDQKFDTAWEDYDFFLTLLKRGGRCALLDKPLVKYRMHDKNMTTHVRRTYQQKRLLGLLLKKHKDLYSEKDICAAKRNVSNRLLIAIIENRGEQKRFWSRLSDLVRFIGESGPMAELLSQMLYTLSPSLYKRRRISKNARRH